MAIIPLRSSSATSPPNPAPSATPTLRLGSKGIEVANLQRLLLARGYAVSTDGIFGNQTKAALSAFQCTQGLTADGIAGRQTWAALNSGFGQNPQRSNASQSGRQDGFEIQAKTQVQIQPQDPPKSKPQVQVQPQVQPNDGPKGHVEIKTSVRPKAQTTTPAIDPTVVKAPATDARAALAMRLIETKGSGTREDAEAVAKVLQRLPVAALEGAERKGLKVIACRNSVTDHMTSLRGVRPRGWPPGATWDSVPGAYDPSKRQVVVATIESNGRRVLPPQGTGHGSADLVLHELGHGLDARDALRGYTAQGREFQAAYAADVPRLRAQNKTYLLQEGAAGAQEAYAETFARYFSGDPKFRQELPAMHAYWQKIENELAKK